MSKLSSITSDDAARPTPINGCVAADRIAVERMTLTDYRNYASVHLLPEGRNVVLTGINGAGKTNVLEAVSFLAPGRGLRRAKLSDVTRCDAGSSGGSHGRTWAVAARLWGPDGIVDVGTGIDPDAVGVRERRAVRIDGQPEKAQSALALHAAVVWLTPQMDGLFLDGPGGRRRFLDRLIYASDPAHAGRVTAYEQAMRERSRLLADKGSQADAGWLDALEENMVGKGMAVAAARRDMVGRLSAFTTADADPFPTAEMSLTGGPEGWLDEGPALAAEDRFLASLREDRNQDAADGRTRTGPHRTDLVVLHGTKGRPAAVCSTGEQKALLIGLVLAHARMQASEQGRRPILLLDEIAAHLDQDRRTALFDLIEALDTQTWMTGTDVALFEGMRGRAAFFKVTDGAILGVAN